MNLVKDLRGSKNVIFTFMQNNDAWKLSNSDTKDSFYGRHIDELTSMQKQYAKTVGADYYFYQGDVVEFVKSKIPNLIDLRMFIQYYDLAKYLLMDDLLKEYDKAAYLDTDIIPITSDCIFDEMTHKDTVYMGEIDEISGKECPFYEEMQNYNKILQDESYKYSGHVNHGVIGGTGKGPGNFIRNNTEKIIKFIKTIDSSFQEGFLVYIGLEHFYVHMLGTVGFSNLNFNLRYFIGYGWNFYPLAPAFQGFDDIKYNKHFRFIHAAGSEAKKWYEDNIEVIRDIVKYHVGEYQ